MGSKWGRSLRETMERMQKEERTSQHKEREVILRKYILSNENNCTSACEKDPFDSVAAL